MPYGIPLAGNFLQQELLVMTGAVEAIIVDVQCIMPALGALSACYPHQFISTSYKASSPAPLTSSSTRSTRTRPPRRSCARPFIAGPDGVAGVGLDTGEDLACEIFCIGKGVRPNVAFLEGSGIRLDRGVVADEHTVCNVPGVYTADDVAGTFGILNATQVAEVPFVSMGIVHTADTDGVILSRAQEAKRLQRGEESRYWPGNP